jgi:hypothetical protein
MIRNSWADCIEGFILVVEQTNKMHIVPIAAIVGPAYVMWENTASAGIVGIWHVHNQVDLDTYWTVYYLD